MMLDHGLAPRGKAETIGDGDQNAFIQEVVLVGCRARWKIKPKDSSLQLPPTAPPSLHRE